MLAYLSFACEFYSNRENEVIWGLKYGIYREFYMFRTLSNHFPWQAKFLLSLIKDVFKSGINQSLSFENWAYGQPNNFGNNQNFVSISYPNFKWGDWSGDTLAEVICQQEIKGKFVK